MKPIKTVKKNSSPLAASLEQGNFAWMKRGKEIEREAKRHAAETSAEMVPTFWLQDGETKQVRFLSDEPLFSVYRYAMNVRGKWRKFTAPASGEPDPFADSGKSPYMVYVYEIIDVTGYVDKKTKKRIKHSRKFWECGSRIETNLKKIREKFGGLTKRNIEVSREGEGTAAAYTFLPEAPSPMPIPREKEALSPKAHIFYAPVSEERMMQIAGKQPVDD